MDNVICNLSHGQVKFADMIKTHSSLDQYWNWQRRRCDLKGIKEAMKAMSTGELIMTRFYVGLWFGENKLDFDLFEAVHRLDNSQLNIIKEWLDLPFWP